MKSSIGGTSDGVTIERMAPELDLRSSKCSCVEIECAGSSRYRTPEISNGRDEPLFIRLALSLKMKQLKDEGLLKIVIDYTSLQGILSAPCSPKTVTVH